MSDDTVVFHFKIYKNPTEYCNCENADNRKNIQPVGLNPVLEISFSQQCFSCKVTLALSGVITQIHFLSEEDKSYQDLLLSLMMSLKNLVISMQSFLLRQGNNIRAPRALMIMQLTPVMPPKGNTIVVTDCTDSMDIY